MKKEFSPPVKSQHRTPREKIARPSATLKNKTSRSLLLYGSALTVLSLVSALTPARANPSGGTVVSGAATINSSGSTVTIDQLSQRAVIEWQNFSVNQGELTQFLQGNSNAAVLNKVISSLPSNILGQIKANGNVFLVNPNGIVIGHGAQINANSFIASALNVSNAQFMNGEDLKFSGESAAAVINLGEIKANQGDVYLIARQVSNEGHLSASNGEVGIGTGTEIYLSTESRNGTRITVKANGLAQEIKNNLKPGAAIDNKGLIEAARVTLSAKSQDIYDTAINNSGSIHAMGIVTGPDGHVRLSAIGGGGSIIHSGTITAKNYDQSGGRVEVLGDHITLKSGSLIDVSGRGKITAPNDATADNRGTNGGGTVLIGGDYQGYGDIQHAKTVTMEKDAVINANAIGTGDGGKVILWSDELTYFGGTINALGGELGGNGGFVETSSLGHLSVDEMAQVNLAAQNGFGTGGQWLLDPSDIVISDSGGDISTATINATLNGGGNVTIQTTAGAGNGDITIQNATIQKTTNYNSPSNLTFRADGSVLMTNSTIGMAGTDPLNVIFNAAANGGAGTVSLTDSTIQTHGGYVVAGGGASHALDTDNNGILGDGGIGLDVSAAMGTADLPQGVFISNSSIVTGAGDIVMTGQGYGDAASSNQSGVLVGTNSLLSTSTGEIRLTGTGGAGISFNTGVYVDNSSITSANGAIILAGQAGGNGLTGSFSNVGVFLQNGASVSSTGTGASAATITFNGTGGAAQSTNYGVYVAVNTTVTSVDGDMNLTGQAGTYGTADGNNNHGVKVSGTVQSTGTTSDAATIIMSGTGAAADDANNGFLLTGLITSAYGDISLTGQGGSNGLADSVNNYGLWIDTGGSVASTGTGPTAAKITLKGIGGAGGGTGYGILLNGGSLSSANGAIALTGIGGSNGLAGSVTNTGIFLKNGSTISSTGTGANAANITLTGTGGAGDGTDYGVVLSTTGVNVVSTVDGDITITGQGGTNGLTSSSNNPGVVENGIVQSTGTTSDAGKITITGNGGAGDDNNHGVSIAGTITSGYGDIVITGTAGSNGIAGSINNTGISFTGAAVISSTGTGNSAANITLRGTGGAGDSNNYGVATTTTSLITAVDGDIFIRGQAGSSGAATNVNNIGEVLAGIISSTGTGTGAGKITLRGIGGTGDDTNYGIYLNNAFSLITSAYGDIILTGTGGSIGSGTGTGTAGSITNHGIYIYNGSTISSTGTGANAANITLTGTAGAGEYNNIGISLSATGVNLITTVDGDITLTGTGGSDGAATSTDNYGIYAAGIIQSTGTTADAGKITLTGTGGAGDDLNHGVYLNNAGLVTSGYGDILITGTASSDGLTGSSSNIGVVLKTGAIVQSTGTGNLAANITIKGTGGAGDNDNNGITISSSGVNKITTVDGDISLTGQGGSNGLVSSTANYGINSLGIIQSTGAAAGAGKITLTGLGGAGDNTNSGISLTSVTSSITSGYGDITISGQGESWDGGNLNYGVGITYGATITSNGIGADAAKITITGTGAGGGNQNRGVSIERPGTVVTSDSGDITINGTGGGNGANNGSSVGFFLYQGAKITSTGTGSHAAKISITGTGGADGQANVGLYLFGNVTGSPEISSYYGDITLTGVGGSSGVASSNTNYGFEMDTGTTVASYGTGNSAANITINGTGGAGEDNNYGVFTTTTGANNITTIDGDITITGQAGSNGTNLSSTNYGIYLGSLIQSSGTGTGAGKITLTGIGGAGDDNNYGLYISSAAAQIISGYGDILINGFGGSNALTGSANNAGVYMRGLAAITSTGTGAGAAKITINGTGGAGDTGGVGIWITDTNTFVTSQSGDILMNGIGGSNGGTTSSTNWGVYLNGGYISSTGTAGNGAKITLNGTGGAGDDNNHGVNINLGSVTSGYGDITLTGTGGSSSAAGSITNYGVLVNLGSVISSTGIGDSAANIIINGTGGAGDGADAGVLVSANGANKILTVDGDITITGVAGSNGLATSLNNQGISSGGVIQSTGTGTGAGKITLTGTGGAGDDTNYGVYINSATATVTSAYGDITMTGFGGSDGLAGSITNYGVFLYNGATVSSTGTGTGAAKITLTGTGGLGEDNNYGISVSGATILSGYGAISLTGTGMSAGTGTSNDTNYGIGFGSAGTVAGIIRSTGTGAGAANITMNGIGAQGVTGITNRGLGLGDSSTTKVATITAVDGTITMTGKGGLTATAGEGIRLGDMTLTTTGANTADITFNADTFIVAFALTSSSTGNINFKPLTASTTIGLGSGAGSLALSQAWLNFFTAGTGKRIIVGDSVNGTGLVTINGLDVLTRAYDIYGGSIIATNLTNLDASTSTFHSLTGNLQYSGDVIFGTTVLDELKANFYTAQDLIIAPTAASTSIGIAGQTGTQDLTAAEIAGFTHIGRNLIIGDPLTGSGAIRIGAFDLSASPYGIGFYGASIYTTGAATIKSGGELILAGDTYTLGATNFYSVKNTILKPQTLTVTVGVSGGTGTLQITDAIIAQMHIGAGYNLAIGESIGGSGYVTIDGLDLSAQSYGLEFYGSRLNLLNGAALKSGADLIISTDGFSGTAVATPSTMTAAISAKGAVTLKNQTAGIAIGLNETAGTLSYAGTTQFNLSQLTVNADAIGAEKLNLGSTTGGIITWTSATPDLSKYNFLTGSHLILVGQALATSYGLGDGTTGTVQFTTAQLNAQKIGGNFILGNSGGTGDIQIANLNTGYGLQATGGSISLLGGWNAGTNNVTLNATTGNITQASGTLTANSLTLNAAGSIGTSANRLTTAVGSMTYAVGGNLYMNEADGLIIAGGTATGNGVVRIRTTNGAVSLSSGLTMAGDTLIEAGGIDKDLTVTGALTSNATSASTLTLRAGGSVLLNPGANISNSTNQLLNVTLNADRDQNHAGRVLVNTSNITTNGGNLILGGGLDPTTEMAWGTKAAGTGAGIISSLITTGAGNIILNGHGYNNAQLTDKYGVDIYGTTLNSASGQIRIVGTGGNVKTSGFGIKLGNGTALLGATITSATGSIYLLGTSGGTGQTGNSANSGISSGYPVTISSTGTGDSAASITLIGVSTGADDNNMGINFNSGQTITSIDGDIVISGTGAANSQQGSSGNYGVNFGGGTTVTSTGTTSNAAKITITGTGGKGEDSNRGLSISGATTAITSLYGDITLTGTGGSTGQMGSSDNYGVYLNQSVIQSIGTGTSAAKITIAGIGGAGDDNNIGFYALGTGTSILSGSGDIVLTGTGGSNTEQGSNANYGLYFNAGILIQSTGTLGNAAKITINGTGGNGEDSNRGLTLGGASQITSGYGDILINTTGGSNGQAGSYYNNGFYMGTAATITSTGTTAGAAKITINGTAGKGVQENAGLVLLDTGTQITSGYGDITLNGYGASNNQPGSLYNYGLSMAAGTIVQSTGTGSSAAKITMNGTGAGDDNGRGIVFASATVTSIDGDITLNGYGSPTVQQGSNSNYGLSISSTLIQSTGTTSHAAKINLTGVGGKGEDNNVGVYLYGTDTKVSSGYGDIAITATGGSNGQTGSLANYGLYMATTNSIESTGTGANAARITINSMGGAGQSANIGALVIGKIVSVDGDINITASGASNGSSLSSSNYGLQLNGGVIQSTGTTTDAARITAHGYGSTGDDANYGIYVSTTGNAITSVDGAIDLTGVGGSSGWSGSAGNYGITIGSTSSISSTGADANAATITLTGTGGNGNINNHGVRIDGIVTSGYGDIVIHGTGGSNRQQLSNVNHGVFINGASALVQSTGTGSDAATITITGTGGNGEDNNNGIAFATTGKISSGYGDISLTGVGGSNGQTGSTNNYGVYSSSGSIIESTGSGANAAKITISGKGGAGQGSNYGYGSNGTLTSADGAIDITGIGGGNGQTGATSNIGIYLYNGLIQSTGSGVYAAAINLNGTGGRGQDNNNGFGLSGASPSIISAVDGDITVTALGGGVGLTNGIGNQGVDITAGSSIQTTGTGASAGNIVINATGGAGTGNLNNGIRIRDTSTGQITTGAGDIILTAQAAHGSAFSLGSGAVSTSFGSTADITFIGDTYYLNNINISATGLITVAPLTSGTTIGLGLGTGTLVLDNTALSYFHPGTGFVIGNTDVSVINYDTVTLPTGTYDLSLLGHIININGAIASPGKLNLLGTTSVISTGALSSIGDMIVTGDTISGTTADSSNGSITLTGDADISFTGGANANTNLTVTSDTIDFGGSSSAVNGNAALTGHAISIAGLLTGGTLQLSGTTSAISSGALSSVGDLQVTGDTIQGANVSSSNGSIILTGGDEVTLTGGANAHNALTVTANAINISGASSATTGNASLMGDTVRVGGLITGGTLNLLGATSALSTGAVSSVGNMVVTGDTIQGTSMSSSNGGIVLTGDDEVTLTGGANAYTSLTVTADAITISGASSATTGNASLTGDTIGVGGLATGGSLNLLGTTSAISTGALSSVSDMLVTGALIQGTSASSSNGAVTLTGNSEVTFSGGANAHGNLIVTADSIAISGASSATVGNASLTGHDIATGGIVAGGTLDLIGTTVVTNTGTLSSGGNLQVTGNVIHGTSIASTGGNTTLTGNTFLSGGLSAHDYLSVTGDTISIAGTSQSSISDVWLNGDALTLNGVSGGDLDITGTGFVTSTGALTGTGNVGVVGGAIHGTGITSGGNIILSGNGVTLTGGANAQGSIDVTGTNGVSISGASAAATGNASITGDIVSLNSGLSGAAVEVVANQLNLGGALTSTGVINIRPMNDSVSIGLGGGAGTLNLDDAELALLHAGKLTIGSVIGSGSVTIDSVSTPNMVHNFEIDGGSISVNNGLSVNGTVFLKSNTGNVYLNSGTVSASGTGTTLTIAALGGDIYNRAGASVLNTGTGHYALYANSPVMTQLQGAELSAQTIYYINYGDTVPTGGNLVLFRRDFNGAILGTGILDALLQIRSRTDRPNVEVSDGNFATMSASFVITPAEAPINQEGMSGIGLDDKSGANTACFVSADQGTVSCSPAAGE